MRRHSQLILAGILAAAAASPASAQQTVQVQGTVVDAQTGQPIPAVDIVVRSPNDRFIRNLISDDNGEFRIAINKYPGIWLSASRIGYADNRSPVLYFDDKTYFDVELRLDPSAVLLAPLEVVAMGRERRSPILSGFDRRLRNGSGFYITRVDIERRKPSLVSDILATVPGVRIESSGFGARRMIHMARAAGRNCPVQLYVDGMQVTRRQGNEMIGVYVDDFVTPSSVEGIEVYRGSSAVPPEFLTAGSNCGVIAIWTRRGG